MPETLKLQKLRLLACLGIKTDLEKTYRHSFIAIIDGGNVVQDVSHENLRLSAIYRFGNHSAEIISQGWNYARSPICPVSVNIDGTEYAVSKRGLNFVIWDKQSEKVIDSVCFDTWDNVSFARKQIGENQ